MLGMRSSVYYKKSVLETDVQGTNNFQQLNELNVCGEVMFKYSMLRIKNLRSHA